MIHPPPGGLAAEPGAIILPTRLGSVECAIAGEGPPVLLLHGAMGGYDQSLLLGRAALGQSGFHRIAVSRPGYLGSPLSLGETPERQADLYAAILDALGIQAAGVVAISGGGQSALQFALRHTARCSALVMISACSAPLTEPLPWRFRLMKLMARIPPLANAMRKKMAKNPGEAARRSIPDPALRARTLAHPEAGPLLIALQASTLHQLRQRLPGTENDIASSRRLFNYPFESLSMPVLIVHGKADRMVPFQQAVFLLTRAPRAELHAIETGEHVVLFTHLDEVRARVSEFLNPGARR